MRISSAASSGSPPAPHMGPVNASDQDTLLRSLRLRFSLDGEWTFQFGDESPQTILVPAPWESARPDLRNKSGTAIFEKRFTLPGEFAGERIVLRFGAVDYYTEVWLNGHAIGSHEGGYTPFEFDVAGVLHDYGPDTVHTLLVRVTDCTVEQDTLLPNGQPLLFAEIPHGKQSWYTSVGGIWQSVCFETRPRTCLVHAAIAPDIDAGIARANLVIEPIADIDRSLWQVRITVDSPIAGASVESRLISLAGNTAPAESDLQLNAEISIPNAVPWSPDEPHLYRALVTLEHDGEVVDALKLQFGMRKIEAKEGRVWLNNRPIFIAGALDQAFYPRTIYTAPSVD